MSCAAASATRSIVISMKGKVPSRSGCISSEMKSSPRQISATRKRFRNRTMDIKPIRTKADHRAALKEIERLMSARPGTPEGDRLDVLATLVEAWEKKR